VLDDLAGDLGAREQRLAGLDRIALAARSTSSKTTVAPGSPSIEAIRSVVPGSAR
jgi:hypothetical protein